MSRRQKKEAKVDEEFGDFFGETVDGNQKSDDHQLRLVGFPHYLLGIIHPNGGSLGFLSHQQYVGKMLGKCWVLMAIVNFPQNT